MHTFLRRRRKGDDRRASFRYCGVPGSTDPKSWLMCCGASPARKIASQWARVSSAVVWGIDLGYLAASRPSSTATECLGASSSFEVLKRTSSAAVSRVKLSDASDKRGCHEVLA